MMSEETAPQPPFDEPLACLLCGGPCKRVWERNQDHPTQPYGATVFTSHGQYGSTVFDEVDGTYLQVNIHDRCLVNAAAEGRVWHGTPVAPVRQPAELRVWEPPSGDGDATT